MGIATVVCVNRKAKFEYEIQAKYHSGLVLLGSEVKPVRAGLVNLNGAYIGFNDAQPRVFGLSIGETGNSFHKHEAKRTRALLLKKREIRKLIGATQEKGITLIPLQIYISDTGFVKMEFGVCKGKKQYDKRRSIKERELTRETSIAVKTQLKH